MWGPTDCFPLVSFYYKFVTKIFVLLAVTKIAAWRKTLALVNITILLGAWPRKWKSNVAVESIQSECHVTSLTFVKLSVLK